MNNKVLVSLVVAGMSAMASAPEALADIGKTDVINLNSALNSTGKTAINDEDRESVQRQIDSILAKKKPMGRLNESIGILIGSYGEDDVSIKDKITREILAVSGTDSTGIGTGGLSLGGESSSGNTTVCHAACHSACHSACHGARGWR